ncbi:Mov34/MPN/PAD-1 family protein [uncultured Aliivibrio sp.]|uniref:Mov34/MPN/PAD-1 family protein n=1 Tax=uncultured Aliivibrio sp. TaxID=873085 RepID=UPI00261A0C26|nr:Mov34/MPN/PAD-1 family protein [uncultured Aliivibrio sp.]
MTKLPDSIPSLLLYDEVILKLKEYQQLNRDDKEACGVLIGGYDTNKSLYIISDITTPLPEDIRSRTSFKMLDKGHQKAVDSAFGNSGGKKIYLGTWHTHPEAHPEPSSVDIDDWKKCMKRNEGRNLFFVIVGKESFRIFVYSEVESGFNLLMTRSIK